MTTIVKKMILLSTPAKKVLLPSAGIGNFYDYFPKYVGIESDAKKNPPLSYMMDFFDYPIHHKFHSIVGIIPCAPFKKITGHKLSGYDKHTNLYVFYLDKCLDHLDKGGELIVMTPVDFMKSSTELNKKIYQMGTITDVIQTNKTGYIIWRFVKDSFSRRTMLNGQWRNFTLIGGQLMFLNNEYVIPFNELFSVKVGAISGLDEVFASNQGNTEFVTSQTGETNKTKKMFFNVEAKELEPYKKRLLARRVKKFNESNWWTWGRNHYISNEPRIYVPCKTKNPNPFFHSSCQNYDGSVLAIFFKDKVKKDPAQIVDMFNKVDWAELGFFAGKRFLFSQQSLESVMLPKNFTC